MQSQHKKSEEDKELNINTIVSSIDLKKKLYELDNVELSEEYLMFKPRMPDCTARPHVPDLHLNEIQLKESRIEEQLGV